ncbi:MAG: bifunctional 5,10-methylenetetrahydrofolate dehydrogenase/5,10-methenyltetrahydrofolate cyclohydrolase [Actinobacteria bacterium]|nr:bifunctional 5,10-methylenetetrahydrofolate dehydrogenase/5,10-methenyltetrahydrofolate cyclohydrolase [Actinomycetota bacterium]
MSARVLDGKAIAAAVKSELTARVAKLHESGVTPGLAAVLVGEDPASKVYVGGKRKDAAEIGMLSIDADLPGDVTQEHLLEVVQNLNADPAVHGIIVQLPLPRDIDPVVIQEALDPGKDVDGLHPENVGLLALGRPRFVPCTPAGCVEILRRSDIDITGKLVAVVGRSTLVGRPLSILLSTKAPGLNATVTLCHTGTADIASETLRADVIVVAAGHQNALTAEMVSEGAVVIDVGINRTPEGKLVGDVDYENVSLVAGAITPVPGGVGPMTRAMLMANTVEAAEAMA